jgi:purine-cytosine permease-like protein
MDHDEEVGKDDAADLEEAAPGPRRSTFTPPTGPAIPLVPPTDDDALADALAADLERIASGPITVVTPESVIPPGPAMAPPPTPVEPLAPPAWSDLPAPDPSTQAIPIIDGPPVRRSLPDDELARWVAEAGEKPGGTLDIIEQLQTQMDLREAEAREFRAWEERMRSLGTPDALGAVENAKPQFSGVLPDAPSAPVPDSPTIVAAPRPEPVAVEPEPVAEPAAPAPPPPLPAWDVPAPSPTWSPAPEWEQAAVAETPPPATEPAPRAPFDWSAETAPAPLIEPAPPARAPSIPVVEADDEVVVPTLEPDGTGEIPDAVDTPELTVEPLPDTGPEIVAPPPLIEPAGFGAPPVVPVRTVMPDDDDTPPGARSFDWTQTAAPPRPEPAPSFAFDDLLAEEPPLRTDAQPADTAPEVLFIEPMSVAAGEPVPTDTGSITVVDQSYEQDIDDDVDETDRVVEGIRGPVSVDAAGIAAVSASISPPSGPISTVRIPADEQVLFDDEPVRQPIFSIEKSDVEPTPVDHRVGRAARMFWLWFAANSSILSLGLGAAVFAVGLSLRQSIVAILAGVVISFLPLGLTTLAGKRSGQPTMIVSRASFGLLGNVIPSFLALVTRLFWGAVLLWLLGSSVTAVLVGAGLDGALGERQILLLSLAGAFLLAVLVAFAGYPMIALIQLVLSIISGILVVGLIAMTYRYIDIPQALTAPDGPWLLTLTGAVLVFSFVGLVWAFSGADLARYQRVDSSGASSMLWATFGTAVPSFLLIGYGALLAASDKGIASGFLLSPLDTLRLMLPSWYPVPLIAAAALSLLSGIILSLYSGGFALQAIGIRVRRQWSTVIVAVLLGGLALLLGFGFTGGLTELFRDAATTLAVPTAAWAGIFAAETMIRNRRFESQSLVKRGGVYADVRAVNVIGLIVFTAVGYGLTTATVSWLSWQGYGFPLLGIPLDSDLASTDVGVFVALGLGLLLPIVAGIPAIRKQEAARAPE